MLKIDGQRQRKSVRVKNALEQLTSIGVWNAYAVRMTRHMPNLMKNRPSHWWLRCPWPDS